MHLEQAETWNYPHSNLSPALVNKRQAPEVRNNLLMSLIKHEPGTTTEEFSLRWESLTIPA